jgi:hypothetical protein
MACSVCNSHVVVGTSPLLLTVEPMSASEPALLQQGQLDRRQLGLLCQVFCCVLYYNTTHCVARHRICSALAFFDILLFVPCILCVCSH